MMADLYSPVLHATHQICLHKYELYAMDKLLHGTERQFKMKFETKQKKRKENNSQGTRVKIPSNWAMETTTRVGKIAYFGTDVKDSQTPVITTKKCNIK